MATKPSLYKVAKKRLTVPGNVGYDFAGKIMINSVDNELLKNPKINAWAVQVDAMIVQWINMVKQFKAFRNFYMDKDETQFN